MVSPPRAALSSGLGLRAGAPSASRPWTLSVSLGGTACARSAPRPQPRRIAAGLDTLLTDGAPVCALAPARYAAEAFAAGDGILPGQIIDRAI